jgi:glycosidase
MEISPTFEFHVSRAARDRYQFKDAFFSLTGSAVFSDIAGARQFAHRMNQFRQAEGHPEGPVSPATLLVIGLIDEIQHALVARYREERDARAILDALDWFEKRLGREALRETLLVFADEFPTNSVYRGQAAQDWLNESTGGIPNRAIALEEMIFLWLANLNHGYRSFRELFEDAPLGTKTAYQDLVAGLHDYFETRPRYGPDNENLISILRAPALTAPDSVGEQLAFIRERWMPMLGEWLLQLLARTQVALDILKEEEIATWMRFHPSEGLGAKRGGPGAWLGGDSSAGAIPHFGNHHEYEAFSRDIDWMPRTVMLAKTVYVWLDQLSKAYRRSITRLDLIPDEELETMARRGFNSLWLIGIWERSRASQHIKQLTGNPEAVASAYSLADYNIAEDLGGESAYKNLRERAGLRGIRLASDMVPNHMGIDSRWVMQHPDWFLSLPFSPYPVYSFEGPDLSSDGRVEIKIEDHYYQRSDAAVVFRRRDRWTGDIRYIYHGNDGTSFPWNDTAQLNYLRADTREAVIQTILHVARMFPIIRFDAAMTLAKRHYRRLWFPEPGSGGAIPSRAEHGMSRADFDRAMPVEFWREVVDRVNAEVPGTLLLAEAFWLMEGYFVRTLGMHRVYNSAFMNMLRDEENANYRSVMKNTLEFDPDVLRRYVNFMNNPDERTAVDQFGKGDKYFGVCTLMSTMPGLPMFGHGQIEGYGERYGMEYRRAYYDESPDAWLVARHEAEISPLLHRRALFAGVENFLLYDFYTGDGRVNEDVFAYSNRLGEQRALIVYHNRYAHTAGWVRISCQYALKQPDGSRHMRQTTLGESFRLQHDSSRLIAFRDAFNGLEYLHRSRDVLERGMRLELSAYKCHVFLDWRDLKDDAAHPWNALCDKLGGQGVASLDAELHTFQLKPFHDAFAALLDPGLVLNLANCVVLGNGDQQESRQAAAAASHKMAALLEQAQHSPVCPGPWSGNIRSAVEGFEQRIWAALRVPHLESYFRSPWPAQARAVLPSVPWMTDAGTSPSVFGTAQNRDVDGRHGEGRSQQNVIWGTIVAWCALKALGELRNPNDPDHAAAGLFDLFRERDQLADAFGRLGLVGENRWRAAARVRIAFAHCDWAPHVAPARSGFTAPLSWVHDADVAWIMGVHEYQGIRYFVKEPFEELLWWMALPWLLEIARAVPPQAGSVRPLEEALASRIRSAEEAGYRVEDLLELDR